MWLASVASIVAVVVLIVVAAAWGGARFDRVTDDAIALLYAGVRRPEPSAAPITDAAIDALPPPVARWLRRAGVIGRPPVSNARLRQRGEMRTAPGQPFVGAHAEQYFAVEPPGFVWAVRLRMKGLPIAGRDAYLDGRGRMLITVGGLVPIVDATGSTIDQGTLLRFLGEIIWFPGAALAPYITWRAIDDVTAEATMTHGGVTATARFTVDADGRVTGFRARRYMDDRGGAHLEDWYVPIDAWARFDGVEVGTRGAVIWQLAAGAFEYYRWEITALEHDRPARLA